MFNTLLEPDTLPFTKGLINLARLKHRETVLFTNGLGLREPDTLQALLKTNYVHVSLDAGSAETFQRIKGTADFDTVLAGVRELCHKATVAKADLKVGLGCVVSQQNHGEVEDVVNLAREMHVHFVRFRRDIHRPDAIGWRAWCEARAKINYLKSQTVPGSPEIWITAIPRHHWGVQTERCWSQNYYVTVGPDGLVYPCDHLTGCGSSCSLGSLKQKELKEILTQPQRARCETGPYCLQCPPFNYRANRLLDELHVLNRRYTWEQVAKWINEAIAG